MAWLNAGYSDSNPGQSRRDFFESRGLTLEMPECAAPHLLDYLFELGICPGGEPLTHGEIKSWQDNTGISLESFEARTIKRLSTAYCEEQAKAKGVDAETAWTDAPGYMRSGYIKAMKTKESIRKAAGI